ncbi:hypothetical protein ACFYQ5_35255 [Streptomyces sp. NPDC005794]|uniref:hypothetical protein n=1 Tax=Streptomyces sp. NPDC005794 TaxID=3364733 RepID=UPI0036A307C9
MALEIRDTADETARTCAPYTADQERVLRIEPHACVAVVSEDSSSDRFLARLLDDRAGRSVSVYGTDTATDPAAVRRLVGVGFDDLSTAEEPVHEVLMAAGRHRGLSQEAAAQRTTDLTDVLDLRAVKHAPLSGLSPGQRSRAALGRALLHVPKLLLLLRPLDDVDSASEKIICGVLNRYSASTGTVVFSTRSRQTAHHMVDRLIPAHDGEVCFGCRAAGS